jgi:REP element-mobilizing transposase RayT
MIYKWFSYLRNEKKIQTTAYATMPNHMHCILFFPTSDFSLNKIVGNAKRFIAHEIIKRLQDTNQTEILKQLKEGVSAKEKDKDKYIKYLKKVLMQKV